jgi:hypothetical protein
MAISRWVNVTFNANTGATQAPAVQSGADAGSLTVAYDPAVITTHDQARTCLRVAELMILGQLGPP